MNYKIVRIDGKEDDVTSQTFSNFADAYDLLDEIYGDCLLYTSPSPRDRG